MIINAPSFFNNMSNVLTDIAVTPTLDSISEYDVTPNVGIVIANYSNALYFNIPTGKYKVFTIYLTSNSSYSGMDCFECEIDDSGHLVQTVYPKMNGLRFLESQKPNVYMVASGRYWNFILFMPIEEQ